MSDDKITIPANTLRTGHKIHISVGGTIVSQPLTPEEEQMLTDIKRQFQDDLIKALQEYEDERKLIEAHFQDELVKWQKNRK